MSEKSDVAEMRHEIDALWQALAELTRRFNAYQESRRRALGHERAALERLRKEQIEPGGEAAQSG